MKLETNFKPTESVESKVVNLLAESISKFIIQQVLEDFKQTGDKESTQ